VSVLPEYILWFDVVGLLYVLTAYSDVVRAGHAIGSSRQQARLLPDLLSSSEAVVAAAPFLVRLGPGRWAFVTSCMVCLGVYAQLCLKWKLGGHGVVIEHVAVGFGCDVVLYMLLSWYTLLEGHRHWNEVSAESTIHGFEGLVNNRLLPLGICA